MFGATNTFGQPASSLFAPQFGFGTKFAFGSPTPIPFGCSACGGTGAFGFGHNPTFGCEFAPTQSSPFGSTAHHNNHCLHFVPVPVYLVPPHSFVQLSLLLVPTSLPLVQQAPAFGATSTPAFGTTSIPGFGVTRGPFESTGTAFGVSNALASGSGGTFGASSTPVVAISSNPAFGASSTPFSFCFSPAFVQPTATFGATSFGTQSFPFGSQSSSPAFQSTTFGQSAFWGQRGGSRVAPYTPTTEAYCGGDTHLAAKLESISAMFVYKDKSHEELRLEDYQSGDKCGPQPAQPSVWTSFGVSAAPASPFGSPATFNQTSVNPFYSTSASPFSAKNSSFENINFPTSTSTTPTSTTKTLFSFPPPAFATGSSATHSFSSPPSIFGTGAAPATAPSFATGAAPGTAPSFATGAAPATAPLFATGAAPATAPSFATGAAPATALLFATGAAPATTPSFATGAPLATAPSFATGAAPATALSFATGAAPATAPSFATGLDFSSSQSSSLFNSTFAIGQAASTSEQIINNFGSRSIFNTPSTRFVGNMLSSTLSSAPSSNPAAFSSTTPAQTAGAFGISNLGQTQSGL